MLGLKLLKAFISGLFELPSTAPFTCPSLHLRKHYIENLGENTFWTDMSHNKNDLLSMLTWAYSFISISNHMFMSEIWDKLTEIFFEISKNERGLLVPNFTELNMLFLVNHTLQILNSPMIDKKHFKFHETNKTFSTSTIFIAI